MRRQLLPLKLQDYICWCSHPELNWDVRRHWILSPTRTTNFAMRAFLFMEESKGFEPLDRLLRSVACFQGKCNKPDSANSPYLAEKAGFEPACLRKKTASLAGKCNKPDSTTFQYFWLSHMDSNHDPTLMRRLF